MEIECTYSIDLYRLGQAIVIHGRDRIASSVRHQIAEHYRQVFHAELPIRELTLDVDRLVERHEDKVTKLHAQLKNTEGLSSTTLYGDDLVRSHIYQTMLTAATMLTAKLRNPFGHEGITVEFNQRGTFSSDSVLLEDTVLQIVEAITDDYSA